MRRCRDLTFNKITGTLPSSWSTMKFVGSIAIDENNITGTLPATWASMTSLTSL
jgi:hypothetical protein